MPDALTCTPTTWRGAPAVAFENGRIHVVVTARGGHLCSLTSCGDDLNPLWQPQWQPGDPGDSDPATAALLDGICGSKGAREKELCKGICEDARPQTRRYSHFCRSCIFILPAPPAEGRLAKAVLER